MSLTQEKIKHLRKLTALQTDDTVSIDSVLDSFEMLKNGDLTLPEVIARSGAGTLLPREDIVHPSPASRDSLLACSRQRVVGHQIALGSIMHGE